MALRVRYIFLVLIILFVGCTGLYKEKFSDILPLIDQQASSLGFQSGAIQLNQTISSANRLLDKPFLTVTDKPTPGIVPDNRLYVSLATYWWPDPDSEDGLPYIRRDGKINPETTGEQSDLPRLIEMAQRVELLADAYKLSGDKKYAERAIEQLYVWFIDEGTSMYPHLEHAQMVRGLNRGRSYGVIDTWWLVRVVESFPYLRRSAYWNDEIENGLRAWFTHYLNWLRNSEFGKTEMQAKNNHGTWYDLQVITFARFVGQEEFALDFCIKASEERIADQVAISGRQTYEYSRTRPLHYSIYNLNGLLKLAVHAQELGADMDLKEHWLSGSLEDALLFLVKKMSNTDPKTLIDPHDPTETDRLYLELLQNSRKLFGNR